MATIPASLKTRIDTDWTGAGGTAPTVTLSETYRVSPPLGKDAVWIITSSLDTDSSDVHNDTFVNERHTIDLIVNTATDEDRLKELADEVVRIIGATAITGATYQRVKKRQNISDKKTFNFQELIKVDIREQMKSSAASYGAAATTTFTVDELTVNTHITGLGLTITDFLDEDAMGSDSAAALCSQQSIKAYVDATVNSIIGDLGMYGSGNAAWVPAIFIGGRLQAQYEQWDTGVVYNLGANNISAIYSVPLPTTKGSLKLYISGVEVGLWDADGVDDYVTDTRVYGIVYDTFTELDRNTGNLTSAAAHQDTFTAVDCSAHKEIRVSLACVNNNAQDLDISYVLVRVYYAT